MFDPWLNRHCERSKAIRTAADEDWIASLRSQ
jgi:hypothetical protein